MIEWIWGFKTIAILDAWTFEHLFSGLSIGSLVKKDNKRHLKKHYPGKKFNISTIFRMDILFVLFLAYLWETVEHYLEQGLLGNTVQYWFQGTEYWPNRIIADPLMLVIGYLIIKQYPQLVWPARILSIVWLIFHIFIFPHSMYLHTMFG